MPFWDMTERKVEATYDALLVLRADTGGNVAATTAETGISLPVRKSLTFDVIVGIQNTIASFAAGTADWTFNIQVSDTLGGTYTTVATWRPVVGTPQKTRLSVHSAEVANVSANAAFIRVQAVLTGAAGAVDYYAFVAKSER